MMNFNTIFLNRIWILFACCLLAIPISAQKEQCSHDQAREQLLKDYPEMRQQVEQQRSLLFDKMNAERNNDMTETRSTNLYTIPVVIHIMHLGESIGTGSNISDAQAISAIDALNDDFRAFSTGIDSNIEYCLAKQDPNGNFSTGINRVDASGVCASGVGCYSSVGIIPGPLDVAVKSLSLWPNDQYYNIWVVSGIGTGAIGYAYFPGAPPAIDGTVVQYDAFGTVGNLNSQTAQNKTLTHEVGHGMNLYHTFEGDGNGTTCPSNSNCLLDGDGLCDTPPHIRSPFNCNDTGTNACDGGSSNALYVHNYMEYSNESCRVEFTNDQIDRMRAAIDLFRPTLLTSIGCTPGCTSVNANFTPSATSGPAGTTITFNNTSSGGSNYLWLFDGQTASTTNITHTFNSPGVFSVCLQASDGSCVDQHCELIEIDFTDACNDFNLPPCELVLNGEFDQNNVPAGSSYGYNSSGQVFDRVCNWGNMASSPFFCSDVPGENSFGLYAYNSDQESVVTETELPLVDGETYTITFEYWVGHQNTSNLNPPLRIQAALRNTNGIVSLSNSMYDNDAIIAQVDLPVVQGPISNVQCPPSDAAYQFHSETFTYNTGDGKYLYFANVSGAGYTIAFIRNVHINGCTETCDAEPDFNFDVDKCSVSFHGTNTGDQGPYVWDFGDGEGAIGQNVSHDYFYAGTYEVCLTIACDELTVETFCQDVVVEAPCKGDCLVVEIVDLYCKDQGTFNPDDDYWYFTMIVTDYSGAGVNWTTSGDILESGSYSTLKWVYPDGGNVNDNPCYTFTVFDVENPECRREVTVCAPPPCSEPCRLKIKYDVTECKNAETEDYISDDYYYVTLTITGSSGQPWMVKQKIEDPISGYPDEVLLASGSGDQTITLGPFLIQDGDWTMWVFLSDYFDCLVDTFIKAPEFCSGCHEVEIGNVQCYDNGTSDPNDDYWTFDIFLNGPGDFWSTDGDVNESGPYGITKTIHMGSIIDYGSEIEFSIMDNKDEKCVTKVKLRVPKGCSDECKMEAEVKIDECKRGEDGSYFYPVYIDVHGSEDECWMAKKKNVDGSEEILGTYFGDQTVFLGLFPAGEDWTLWISICEKTDCVRDFYIDAPDCGRDEDPHGGDDGGHRFRTATDVTIYPNPVGGDILRLTSLTAIGNVKVLDTNGRVWIDKSIESNSKYLELAVDILPNGVYYIQLELEEGTSYIDRIVKMK